VNCPNFFIVGFPKCGTTSLAHYLSEHPDICISSIKEPYYFALDLINRSLSGITDLDSYLELFDQEKAYKAIGEASVGYIYSDCAIENILAFVNEPKFIVVVRNPIEIAQSAHAQMLKDGNEDVKSFDEAWSLSDSRMMGECLPNTLHEKIFVAYKEIGKIGTYLERFLGKVPRDSVHIIVYDDMLKNMSSVYAGVLRFLGVPVIDRTDFPILNPRTYVKSKLFSQILNKPPRSLLNFIFYLKRIVGIERLGLKRKLLELNASRSKKEIPENLSENMKICFHEEVHKLEFILNRKLEWL
jgi:hypothetical protein